MRGQRDGGRGASGVLQGEVAVERFAADVAEGELDGAGCERDGGDAGEFADGLAFGGEGSAGCGERPVRRSR